MGPVADAGPTGSALEEALLPGAITSVYQPIVDLHAGHVVAMEALARGPRGPLETPDALFAAARAAGRLAALEFRCQEAAVTGALRARLGMPLFVNVEPEGIEGGDLPALRRVEALAGGRVPLVLEITERALTARPAELIDLLARARERGWGIALDDVGADPRSLALMTIVRPDIIKLDRELVQRTDEPHAASVVTAIAAECERTGAVVLAEGVESPAHRRAAAACGAQLGQGYLFGRPGPLAAGRGADWCPPRIPALQAVADEATPFDVVAAGRAVRPATWSFLLQISLLLESQAASLGAEVMIVSAFQDARRFTPDTARRYEALAERAALVAALGVGMASEPAPGVRGAALPADHRLRGEWSVAVLSPHFSAALVAVERPGTRTFDHAVTYDRALVARAATSLLRQVARVG